MQQKLFTGKQKVELVSREQEKPASNGNLIGGKTLFSLVSAGTELHYGYLNLQNNSFPPSRLDMPRCLKWMMPEMA